MLQRELRQRLLAWDPIGIGDAPEAQDEYDSLLSPVMHLLHDGASATDLASWLVGELDGHFGLTPRPDREREFAAELVGWWRSRTAAAP
jgi:hypothetical protein